MLDKIFSFFQENEILYSTLNYIFSQFESNYSLDIDESGKYPKYIYQYKNKKYSIKVIISLVKNVEEYTDNGCISPVSITILDDNYDNDMLCGKGCDIELCSFVNQATFIRNSHAYSDTCCFNTEGLIEDMNDQEEVYYDLNKESVNFDYRIKSILNSFFPEMYNCVMIESLEV